MSNVIKFSITGDTNAEQVTKLEEDRITAYFGSGHLLAIPSRSESLI